MASNHGVNFRGARAEEDNGKHILKSFAFILASPMYNHAATVQHSLEALPVVTLTDAIYACVDTAYACVCVCVRVRAGQ